MDFLIITIVNLLWLAYTLSEGVRVAFFNYCEVLSRRKSNVNVNKIYTTQRLLVSITTSGIMFWVIGFYFIPFIIGQILMFGFFYKKSYDRTINYLKIRDEKKEEKKLDLKKEEFVLLGVALQVFIYLFI